MKNSDNDKKLLKYLKKNFLTMREIKDFEIIEPKQIVSKCVLNEKKSLLFISPCTNTDIHD